MKVEIEVFDDFMGNVIGDFNVCWGYIEGQEMEQGIVKVVVSVLLVEMFGYVIDIWLKI